MQKMETYLGWKIDFANPPGAAAYCQPDSICWRVYKNPVALGIGGVAAVLLEFADPRIRSGVWDHSTYKVDPIGRSRRTAMAAMIGVYGPKPAAQRVIQGVNNMHARVGGNTPGGEAYQALDPDLLDWVSATALWGFLTAYDRFVAPLSEEEKVRFYAEHVPISRLYGVRRPVASEADFTGMLQSLLPRFEAHPILSEFLDIVSTRSGAIGLPKFLRRALVRAAVSILPPVVRERLSLGAEYRLSPLARSSLRAIGALADRIPIRDSPPTQASVRLGLSANFLYRSRKAQARLLAARMPIPDPGE